MSVELGTLLITAISLGTFHTLIGIDHYIPFVALSKANHWKYLKTMAVVLICGLGHVLSSVLLGLVGIWLGAELGLLQNIDNISAFIAMWFLIGFGTLYALWGVWRAYKNKPHRHTLPNGHLLEHTHHAKEHQLEDPSPKQRQKIVFWGLFIVLVLGPCEPLIPLMFSASAISAFAVGTIILIFGLFTIATMLICTTLVLKGINLIKIQKWERYGHIIAGVSLVLCGIVILLFEMLA